LFYDPASVRQGELKVSACPIGSTFFAELYLLMTGFDNLQSLLKFMTRNQRTSYLFLLFYVETVFLLQPKLSPDWLVLSI